MHFNLIQCFRFNVLTLPTSSASHRALVDPHAIVQKRIIERSLAQAGIGQAQKSKVTPTETKSTVKSTRTISKPAGISPSVRPLLQKCKIPNVQVGST